MSRLPPAAAPASPAGDTASATAGPSPAARTVRPSMDEIEIPAVAG